jgi:hypothetical protein
MKAVREYWNMRLVFDDEPTPTITRVDLCGWLYTSPSRSD